MATKQDFSIVQTKLNKIQNDNTLHDLVSAFYILSIASEADLNDDEILDTITDSHFLMASNNIGGHDRGIDAVHIDETVNPPTVHLFNCKYVQNFEKAKSSHFPSSEIEKISEYLRILMDEDLQTLKNSNPLLEEKTKEIWELLENDYPRFKIHLCSNHTKGLEPQEKGRLESIIRRYSNIELIEHTLDDYSSKLIKADRKPVNAKVQVSQKELFEKSDGNIRALVVNIKAIDLMRIILDNEDLRNNYSLEDISELTNHLILEETFYDNVRVYKNRTRINNSIKLTAKSDKRNFFFYFNNGITITCSSFEYNKVAHPVIKVEELQIVNGSQTLHALFEVLKEDADKIRDIEILCRIYELKNAQDSSAIAEFTNSQNPVTTRDIRSIDYIQQQLETDFKNMDLFYERKKNQYEGESTKKRIDSEKVGQAMLAYYLAFPSEAKNNKKVVFGEKYEDIFHENLTSTDVFLAHQLYNEVEGRKKKLKREMTQDASLHKHKSFVLYATYFILYLLGALAEIEFKASNKKKNRIDFADIVKLYDVALGIMELVVNQAKEKDKDSEKYTNADYFKTNKPKIALDKYLENLSAPITIDSVEELKKLAN